MPLVGRSESEMLLMWRRNETSIRAFAEEMRRRCDRRRRAVYRAHPLPDASACEVMARAPDAVPMYAVPNLEVVVAAAWKAVIEVMGHRPAKLARTRSAWTGEPVRRGGATECRWMVHHAAREVGGPAFSWPERCRAVAGPGVCHSAAIRAVGLSTARAARDPVYADRLRRVIRLVRERTGLA